jgi:tRNA dimethylallyltransferase
VRALEVCELTGRRFSEFSPSLSSYRELPFPVLGLAAPRDLHRELLLERLCDMFERGLVEEATCIEASGGFSRTAARAHGYLEALAVARGEMDAKEAIEAAFVRIWRYVRRQMQWFRRDPRIVWLTRGSRRLEPQLVESAHAVIAEGRR